MDSNQITHVVWRWQHGWDFDWPRQPPSRFVNTDVSVLAFDRLIMAAEWTESRSEAQKLIKQNAISFRVENGSAWQKVDLKTEVPSGWPFLLKRSGGMWHQVFRTDANGQLKPKFVNGVVTFMVPTEGQTIAEWTNIWGGKNHLAWEYRQMMDDLSNDTWHLSFTPVKHPLYQALKAIGKPLIRHLLHDLEEVEQRKDDKLLPPNPWIVMNLLWEIVPESDHPKMRSAWQGRYKKLMEMWLRWGAVKGYQYE